MLNLPPADQKGFHSIIDNAGHKVGYFSLSEPDANAEVYFTQVYISPEKRGNGYGESTYRAVAAELDAQGLGLVSDPESFSVGALGVWLSLVRSGAADQVGNDAYTVDERGDVYGASFRMVSSSQQLVH